MFRKSAFIRSWAALAAALVFSIVPLWGADISVPRLELASRGFADDGAFAFSTSALADIALNGGYKYGLLLGFSFDAPDLGKALAYRNFALDHAAAAPTADEYNALVDRVNNQAALTFRLAKATARDLFGLPLEFSFFAGLGDPFCAGDEFAARYGVSDIETDFTGFYYFPEGIGGNPRRRYRGLYSVQGAGFSFALSKWNNFIPVLYMYQDFPLFDGSQTLFEKPQFSGDLRLLFNSERFQAEAYSGLSGAAGGQTEVRGGLLAFFRSGQGTEFLLQAGVPGWKTGGEFSIDNIYLLFEPRLTFEVFALHTTFFYHPVEYLHIKEEKERGKADINIKFLFGNLASAGVQGGFETTVGLQVYGEADFSLWASPFVSFLSNGLRWDMKIRVNPLALKTPEKLCEVFAGVKTAF